MASKKFVAKKDDKAEAQQAIQSAINSQYSLLIPIKDCAFIYVKNPVNGATKHFDVRSPELVSFLKELTEMGLGEKLKKDFNHLFMNYDDRWNLVYQSLNDQGCFSTEAE